jgi:hypothetical protein
MVSSQEVSTMALAIFAVLREMQMNVGILREMH